MQNVSISLPDTSGAGQQVDAVRTLVSVAQIRAGLEVLPSATAATSSGHATGVCHEWGPSGSLVALDLASAGFGLVCNLSALASTFKAG